jgi:hypothetical protein
MHRAEDRRRARATVPRATVPRATVPRVLVLALAATAVVVGGVAVAVRGSGGTADPGRPALSTDVPATDVPATDVPGSTRAVGGKHLYVDCTAGNDAGNGSSSRPLRSLAPLAKVDLVPSGTVVALKRGCTFTGGLTIRAASSRITVQAYGTGEPPVLTGRGLAREHGIVLVQAPEVTLTGLHLRDGPGAGVVLQGAAGRLDDLLIERTAFGARILAPRATVTSTRVRDLHMDINTPGGSDDAGAVGFDVWADDVTIRGSSCVNCRATSYDFGHDGGFVEVFNHGDRLKVIGNTATNTQGFMEVGGTVKGGSADDVLVQGNTVVDGHGGVWVHTSDQFAIAAHNIMLVDNVFRSGGSVQVLGGNVGALVLRDNTFVTTGSVAPGGAPAEHVGNRYYVPSPAAVGYPLGSGEAVAPTSAYPSATASPPAS